MNHNDPGRIDNNKPLDSSLGVDAVKCGRPLITRIVCYVMSLVMT